MLSFLTESGTRKSRLTAMLLPFFTLETILGIRQKNQINLIEAGPKIFGKK